MHDVSWAAGMVVNTSTCDTVEVSFKMQPFLPHFGGIKFIIIIIIITLLSGPTEQTDFQTKLWWKQSYFTVYIVWTASVYKQNGAQHSSDAEWNVYSDYISVWGLSLRLADLLPSPP